MSTIHDFETSAFLAKSGAIVQITSNEALTVDKRVRSIVVEPINPVRTKIPKEIKFVPNGLNNGLPFEIMDKVAANTHLASGLDHKSLMYYGDGVMVVKKVKDAITKEVKFEEQLESEQPEIFSFLKRNNIVRQIQEYGVDMAMFHDGFSEITLNKATPPKIVRIRHKEYAWSRVSEINPDNGKIEYHGYSIYWYNQREKLKGSVTATCMLDEDGPLEDLLQRIGIEANDEGKKVDTGVRRFMMRLSKPVCGRLYYNKPPWWSVFTSGWYDYACAIPKFKAALLKNQMTFKYHILIRKEFWAKLYKGKGVVGDVEKEKAARIEWYANLEAYLTGADNAGKSFTSEFEYTLDKGVKMQDIIIEPIELGKVGGELIEDSEESANNMFSALHLHPSVMGATPGKSKGLGGTEARELFIIEQAMTKPIRDIMLQPLYIAKEVNGWDKDIHFVIPNIMLTTLDQGTGAQKNIGNQKI